MKNIIIINCYINTNEKRLTLIECITQLKKLNVDILLISNSFIEESIQNLVKYYIYDSENILLSVEKSPVVWFADHEETIHIHNKSTSYMCCKHIYMSLNFCKSMGYEKFIYTEFDNIFHDNDLFLLNDIFDVLNYKKIWMCNSSQYNTPSYETRFFSGNIDHFIENVKLTKSIDEWNSIHPYSSTSDTLELIFPQIMYKIKPEIYFTNCLVSEFFKKSIIDKFRVYSNINVVYNNEEPDSPILFIISDGDQYEISIDGNIIFNKYVDKNVWIKENLKIKNTDMSVKVRLNEKIVLEEFINLDNITKFKNKAIKYKL